MQQAGNRQIAKAISPTLAINENVARMRESGREVVNMGFGQAPFPAPKRLMNTLCDHARERSYLPVAGLPDLIAAVTAHQALHACVDMEAYNVLVGPGSKILLFAIQMAIPGDILLPVPSWVSYLPQSKLLGQQALPVPMRVLSKGLALEPAAIDQAVRQARSAGYNPTKLLINFPNNPTGLTFDDDELLSIAETCRRCKLLLISDEIYGRLAYDQRYRSAAKHFPEGTVVTTGLSKHLSIGGWRLGISLVPKSIPGLFDQLCHIASETWSCVAAPIQFAAADAYRSHEDIEEFINSTTSIHACVNKYIANQLTGLGVKCQSPQGGFYTWPDFSATLNGVYSTAAEMARKLLDEHRIATLPGVAFGEKKTALKLRLSGCDYSGEKALESWSTYGGQKVNDDFVHRIAPNIITAMRELGSFIENSRNLPSLA